MHKTTLKNYIIWMSLVVASPSITWAATAASAAVQAPAQMVSLSAKASSEVVSDWLSVTLSVQKEGSDAAQVQRLVSQAMTQALELGRAAAREAGEGLEVSTSGMRVEPRYGKEARIVGWVGTGEILVAGRDSQHIARLLGRLDSAMTVAHMNWSVSRALRERTENQLQSVAVQQFRERAKSLARDFGYGDYLIHEVQVSAGDADRPIMPLMARSAPIALRSEGAPLPMEAGKTLITVTVSGSVQLRR